ELTRFLVAAQLPQNISALEVGETLRLSVGAQLQIFPVMLQRFRLPVLRRQQGTEGSMRQSDAGGVMRFFGHLERLPEKVRRRRKGAPVPPPPSEQSQGEIRLVGETRRLVIVQSFLRLARHLFGFRYLIVKAG